MSIQTAARRAAITALLETWQPSALAAAIVDALATAGEQAEWDSETIELVLQRLESISIPAGLPYAGSWDTEATAYWLQVTGNAEPGDEIDEED